MHYTHIRHMLSSERANEPTVKELAEIIATDIEAVWRKSSIPVVSYTRILKLVRNSQDEFIKLMKPF